MKMKLNLIEILIIIACIILVIQVLFTDLSQADQIQNPFDIVCPNGMEIAMSHTGENVLICSRG